MKTFKYYATILVLAGVLLSSFVYSIDRAGAIVDHERTLRKPLVLSALNFDGNRVDNDLMNNGMIVSHLVSGRSGMSWPKGNGTQTVYASGVWLGARVDGTVRVTAGEYNGELVGGPWGSDDGDPAHKLYKVSRSDWDDPAASDDFQNWPAHQGAPFTDVNGNGTYEPMPSGPDSPDFPGEQVVWAVMNDGDPTAHSVFQTPPLGVEVQMTIFGFDRPDAFGDMMFVKELLINKGGNTLNDMIVGLWSDPDLGDAADDLVGCDTTLGMGICYNAGDDVNFAGYVGGTPAVGYDFFQGPIVPADGETAFMFGREIPNMRNLSMTSFTKYINSDPVYYDPNNAIEAYNYMSGFMPDGSDFPFVASGGTRFVHPGDPNLDTGPDDTEYVDSDLHPPDDRRFLMNAGPFTMAPGDSQEVVFAVFHAAAGDALKSYNLLKIVDAQAQFAYDNNFVLPSAPRKPVFETSVHREEVILTWGSESEIYSVPGPDTPTGEATTFEFEGYNVYQYETANGDNPTRIATFDVVNNITQIKDVIFVAELAELTETTVQNGTDSGLKRSISITADATRQNTALIPQRAYYFGVTAFSYNEWGSPKVLESSPEIVTVRPQAPQDWMATDETAIYGTGLVADHTAGASDGAAVGVVVDPAALTGDSYEVFFANETYYRDVDGVWKNVNAAGKEALEKILDCTGSMVTVSALASAEIGTYDLTFNFEMHCGSNWVDGIVLDFPDGVKVNSWEGIGDFSYGSDAGQNCGNMEGTLAGNTLTYGSDARSGFGCIEGDQHWVVNIDPTSFPINIGYTVIDDVYDGTLVDAVGTASAAELAYDHVTIEGWYARNLSTGDIVTPHTTIQSGAAADNVIDGIFIAAHDAGEDANPIAEGLQFNVSGAALAYKWIGVVANAAGPIDPPVDGLPYWRYPNWLVADGHYDNQQTTGAIWLLNSHPGYGAGGEATWLAATNYASGGVGGVGALIPYDYEFRFTGSDGNGMFFDNWGDGWFSQPAPFEVWNIGISTPDDASDDYQLITWLLDDNADGVWGLVADDHETSGGDNDPYTDRVYVMAPTDDTPGTVGYDNWWTAMNAGGAAAGWTSGPGAFDPGGPLDIWNVFSRTVFMNWNGGDAYDATFPANINALEPETGTVFRLVTTKPNAASDKFVISTADVVGVSKSFDSDDINVWPNPYFGFNPEERDPVDNQLHFINLPMDEDCTIRIFDLSGVPVKTIEHVQGSTLEIWNLKNDNNIPVASGMYIAVVETEDGTKILKIAIIQPEQRLDLYG